MALDFTTSLIKLNNQYNIIGSAQDVSDDTIPKKGELYFDEVKDGERICKIGDGVTTFASLPTVGVSSLGLINTSETEDIDLAYNSKYKLKVGNKNIVFKMPSSGTDYRASSYNTSSKIYLIGATSQGSSTTTGQTTYSHDTAYVGTDGCLYSNNTKVSVEGHTHTYNDTKNTAGSTNSSSKLFLVGATSQAANPQTYSRDTAYVGTDGCLYSNSTKVSVEGHTHSSYANQNAFSNIQVGTTIVAADSTTDTVEFVGSNVTITPDATNDKITFSIPNGSTAAKGIVKLTNSTSSTSTTTAATPNSVKTAYDLAAKALPKANLSLSGTTLTITL